MDPKASAPFRLDPHADPAVEAEALRKRGCPLQHVVLPGGVPAMAALDHTTALQVFGDSRMTKDPAAWTDLQAGRIPADWELMAFVRGAGMLNADGAEHRRLRGPAAAAFGRTPVEALRPRVKAIAGELLDRLEAAAATGPVDLRELFAFPLPVRVVCEILGFPDTAVTGLRRAFERLVTSGSDAGPGRADIRSAEETIAAELAGLVAAKREHPADDLATALIQARDEDGNTLGTQELIQTMFLILIAGHETTVNLVTSVARTLLKDRSLLDPVRDATRTWADVVEEGLRHSPPVRYTLMRYAKEDLELAGVKVARGTALVVSHFGIGRDPDTHHDPERFDLDRPTRRHLAFGHGAHYCLGAALGRLEAAVALEELFARFPDLTLATDPEPLPSIALHGLKTLPVELRTDARPPGQRP
ncbi:cytochrome P450 [Streptomyces sp. NPDC007861]|uniref:cytochrome P450 family protein n=1 Tax=Streptomyces sp. NPDC007861 TaxID=3154893 RepID=UPI0033FACC6F